MCYTASCADEKKAETDFLCLCHVQALCLALMRWTAPTVLMTHPPGMLAVATAGWLTLLRVCLCSLHVLHHICHCSCHSALFLAWCACQSTVNVPHCASGWSLGQQVKAHGQAVVGKGCLPWSVLCMPHQARCQAFISASTEHNLMRPWLTAFDDICSVCELLVMHGSHSTTSS